MDSFYKSYPQIDLALIHYATFIERHVIIWTESINELIEGKAKGPFLLIEDNLFATALLHNKTNEVELDDLLDEVLEYFSES
jgi:hypothetical protein